MSKAERVVTRRVKGSRGVVVVRYSFDRVSGVFEGTQGTCQIKGSWAYVAQMARAYGVPEGWVRK